MTAIGEERDDHRGARVFAEMVRGNRRRSGLTQEELAAKAGLSVRGIRMIEAGQVGSPRPTTVRLLADAFGLAGTGRERFFQAAAGELNQPPAGAGVPAQLPADVSAFTGRDDQLAYLDALLARAGDHPNAVIICAVFGTAGVGKTALAVHWAHRVRDRFPDGQLYLDLRGYDPGQPTTPADALTRLLSALGVAGPDIPQALDERAARYRSEIADRRMLIMLDNAGGVEQVRPLLPGSSSCAVVVTSRDSLPGLVAVHGAYRLELDPLPPGEAVTLLRRLIGPRVDAEPEAVSALVDRCARLPLALRVAAERAVANPTTPLADLVHELADQQQRLDLLDVGDPRAAVRTVFSWSIQRLPPAAAEAFRLLGLHPGPDTDPYAAAALAGTGVQDARLRLDLLTRAHLLHPAGAGRYGMHDLLRAYATELAQTGDTDQLRSSAVGRLMDYYRHTASMAMDVVYPYEPERRPSVPPARTPVPELSDPDRAAGWLDTELPNLLAAARLAASAGWDRHATNLSSILRRHLHTRARYPDAEALHGQALAVARRAGDHPGEVDAHLGLGNLWWRQGRYAEARDHIEQAWQLAHRTGHRAGELDALLGLGVMDRRRGRYQQALSYYGRALTIARAAGYRAGELEALLDLGNIHQRQGRYRQSSASYRRALRIARATGYRAGEMNALFGLGNVHRIQGRIRPSAVCYEQALAIARATGHRVGECSALLGLSRAHRTDGDTPRALELCGQALDIARPIGFRDGEVLAMLILGRIHRAQGRYERASGCYRQILDLGRETGDRNWQFEALHGLGRVSSASGHPESAVDYHQQALALATDLQQSADQARTHCGLAHALQALQQPELARPHWQAALEILTGLDTQHTEDEEVSIPTIRSHLAGLAGR